MSKNDTKVIGINVLRKNVADVDEILNTLIKNASVEFTAYYYLTNIRAHCTGPEGEHEAWFLELLHGRPSGQLRRSFPGESPHTRGHSRSLDRGHG